MSAAHAATSTTGVVFIHCCPPAIGPHVEWALAGVLGRPCKLTWTTQPASPGSVRAEASWFGPIGTGAKLAASLRAWPMLRYEITEDGTGSTDGERLAYVPGRGFHRSQVAANGDVVVGEERLRSLLERARTPDEFRHGLADLLGSARDAELESYRTAGDGAPISLLHKLA